MIDKVNRKLLEARKAKDKTLVSIYSMVKSELINNSKSAKPKDAIDVVRVYAKMLEKAACGFTSGDKFNELQEEVKVIRALLPKEMEENELRLFIEQIFMVRLDFETMNVGEIIKTIKHATGSSNGKVIADTVKRIKESK